jgi:hypothetical protein
MTHRFLGISMHQLDLHCTDTLSALFYHTPHLSKEGDRRRLSFSENIDLVHSHSFLSDENFLGSVDDEVTTLVNWDQK